MSNEQSKLLSMTSSSSETFETNPTRQPVRGESSKDRPMLENGEVSQAIPKKLLNDGNKMPVIGYGTDLCDPESIGRDVKFALKIGYRHLDCAYGNKNLEEIGEALLGVFAKGKIKREELFITSKVWNTHHSYARATENIDTILKQLQLDYVDLMLIHWPQGYEEGDDTYPKNVDGTRRFSNEDYLETWRALEDAKMAGKVKSTGLANFNQKQIERVWAAARIKPAALQVEMHPLLQQNELRAFCAARNIVITARRPFENFCAATRGPRCASADAFRRSIALLNEPIQKMGKSHGKTAEQVTLRWFIQHDIAVIPFSYKANMEDNLKIFDFQLTVNEMSTIDGINRNMRFIVAHGDEESPHYPFSENSEVSYQYLIKVYFLILCLTFLTLLTFQCLQ